MCVCPAFAFPDATLMFISTPCWVAFYSPGSHPAKGNHSNSSRAESRRGAKRGEIITRKAGAGEERLKNKINWRLVSFIPGVNTSNSHPKINLLTGKQKHFTGRSRVCPLHSSTLSSTVRDCRGWDSLHLLQNGWLASPPCWEHLPANNVKLSAISCPRRGGQTFCYEEDGCQESF